MNRPNLALSTWQQLSGKPGGKWALSRFVCWKAPYFSSIRPAIVELRPGYCEARIKKRRRVLNHIGTVRAIAMCNMAELAGGTMMEVTVPSRHRWNPKGMMVQYIRRAETDLKAVAQVSPIPQFDAASALHVTVTDTDADNQTIYRAVITMWVSPRKE